MKTLRTTFSNLALQEGWAADELQLSWRNAEEDHDSFRIGLQKKEHALRDIQGYLQDMRAERSFDPLLASMARRQWSQLSQEVREATATLQKLEQRTSELHEATLAARHRVKLLDGHATNIHRCELIEGQTMDMAATDELWLQRQWSSHHVG